MADISNNLFWSETDDNNNQVSPGGFREKMRPSGVNDSARAVMGAVKRWYNRANAVTESTGTNGAYVLAYAVPLNSIAIGEVFLFRANHNNPGAATLNISGLGATPIKRRNFC